MATNLTIRNRIKALQTEYTRLKDEKGPLLRLLEEAEASESVYNSNAIENSTLTLKETEKILLNLEISRHVDQREIFEAKNLARLMEYLRGSGANCKVTVENMLFLHRMLIGNINEKIAGRFRGPGEYVRVGTHVAPPPERVPELIAEIIVNYASDHDSYIVDKIAKWHLTFEIIHPFNDGNGRIGRVLMNIQLRQAGFPPIIIRDKEKDDYYRAFREYRHDQKAKIMERVVTLAVLESLHKRLAYMRGEQIVELAVWAKSFGRRVPAVLNAARRQSIPAFREKGIWKIGMK